MQSSHPGDRMEPGHNHIKRRYSRSTLPISTCTSLRAIYEASIVLSWRADTSAASSSFLVFSCEGIVEIFIFFENVVTRGKDKCKNVLVFLAHIGGDLFQFYLKKLL